MSKEFYRGGTLKRNRRTNDQLEQLDAQIIEVLREILRDKVEELLPHNALAVARVAEQAEREHLTRVADMLRGGAA